MNKTAYFVFQAAQEYVIGLDRKVSYIQITSIISFVNGFLCGSGSLMNKTKKKMFCEPTVFLTRP